MCRPISMFPAVCPTKLVLVGPMFPYSFILLYTLHNTLSCRFSVQMFPPSLSSPRFSRVVYTRMETKHTNNNVLSQRTCHTTSSRRAARRIRGKRWRCRIRPRRQSVCLSTRERQISTRRPPLAARRKLPVSEPCARARHPHATCLAAAGWTRGKRAPPSRIQRG